MSNTTTITASTPRIRLLAAAVLWAAVAAMVTIVVIHAYSLFRGTLDWALGTTPGFMVNAKASADTKADPHIALWLELLPQVFLLYGFARLVRMMRACQRGELFSFATAAHLRAFSAAIVFAELFDITLPLQIAAIRAALGRPLQALTLSVSGDECASLLVATVFLVLAQILGEGTRLAEDNAGIV